MPGKKGIPKPPPIEKKTGLGGTTFGGFQDSNFTTLDDPFEKKIPVPSRHLGAPEGQKKWIPVPPLKKGKMPDTFFDKETRRLGGGDKDEYTDPGRSKKEKEEREKAKTANLKGAPAWKNPNPTKKMTGCGNIQGTFQDPHPGMKGKPFPHPGGGDNSKLPAEYYVLPRDPASVPDRPEKQEKNVQVAACKRGGFGVMAPGIFFSSPQPLGKDDKKRDTYDAQKEKEKKENDEHKGKILDKSKPFKSSSKSRATFDEQVGGVSKIYTNDKKLPEPKEKKKEEKKDDRPPFKYSPPGKSGESGCLSKWTERGKTTDVYDQKRADEKVAREKAPKNVGGPWQPTAGPKVGCVRSLLQRVY